MAPRVVERTSITATSPVTVILEVEACSEMFSVASRPRPTSTHALLGPEASELERDPRTDRAAAPPVASRREASLIVARVPWSATLEAVTVTPGSAPPLSSETLPARLPVVCAATAPQTANASVTNNEVARQRH